MAKFVFRMDSQEHWWGGKAVDSNMMPYTEQTNLKTDFFKGASNQAASFFLSDHGRCIYSSRPFSYEIKDGIFTIESDADVSPERFGTTLREAYLGAMNKYFPPQGDNPEPVFFQVPQYNTWMEFTYFQTQEGVLRYAHELLENGYRPGILTIDEGWQEFYGKWDFDRTKFPDPKAMVDELHRLGFKVMVWVVPYVRADGKAFIDQIRPDLNPGKSKSIFLRTEDGSVALVHWWNGYSAILNMTNEVNRDYLDNQLRHLQTEYGVDGFKFDGGALDDFSNCQIVNGNMQSDLTPEQLNRAWFDFGLRYPFHEYKDVFNGGGVRSIQRIRDRGHRWDGDGLVTLVPAAISAGLLGHPFICPDMVGGGEWSYRAHNIPVDMELFVRMAECSALFPMMQFSWAPWEAVDKEHQALIVKAAELHTAFGDKLLSLVADACKTGEPIMRCLEYNFPNRGYAEIMDTFMLGDRILVAPVIKKGATTREVTLPDGSWKDSMGKLWQGGQTVTVHAPLGTLPYFELQ